MAEETININVKTDAAGLKKLKNALKGTNAQFNNTSKQAKASLQAIEAQMAKTGTIAEKLGNRFGFIAFQWTFIAGVATRTLQQVRQQAQEVFDTGAAGISAITKASMEAYQIGESLDKTNARMKLFGQYIQEMGAGATIFSTVEVAEGLREVAKATSDVNSVIPITNEVLKLMTIEEVDAAKAAKGFLSVMNNFKLVGADVERVTNTLVAVNKQSRLSLEETIKAYEFSAQQARLMGLSVEETGTIIGMLGDQLPSGTIGRTLTQMWINFRKETVALNPVLRELGVEMYDATGNRRDFASTMKDMAKMMQNAGEQSDYFRDSLLRSMKLDSRAERVFLALINNFDEYEDRLKMVMEGGVYVDFLYEKLKNTPEAAMKRLHNTLDALKINIVAGFTPALLVMLEELMQFVRIREVQDAMHALGKAIGQNVVPTMKLVLGVGAKLIRFFKKMKIGTDELAKIMLALSATLGGLAVAGTVIVIFAMLMGIVERLTTSMVKFGLTAKALELGIWGLTFAVLRLVSVFFGAWLIVSGINRLWDVLHDGLQKGEEAALATAVGMTALGAAMVALPLKGTGGLFATLASKVGLSAASIGSFTTMTGVGLKGIGLFLLTKGPMIALFAGIALAAVAAGKVLADFFISASNIQPSDDWATRWQKFFAAFGTNTGAAFLGPITKYFNHHLPNMINQRILALSIMLTYWGDKMGEWMSLGFQGKWDEIDLLTTIQDGVKDQQEKWEAMGKALGEAVTTGFQEAFGLRSLWDTIWNYLGLNQDTEFARNNPDLGFGDKDWKNKEIAENAKKSGFWPWEVELKKTVDAAVDAIEVDSQTMTETITVVNAGMVSFGENATAVGEATGKLAEANFKAGSEAEKIYEQYLAARESGIFDGMKIGFPEEEDMEALDVAITTATAAIDVNTTKVAEVTEDLTSLNTEVEKQIKEVTTATKKEIAGYIMTELITVNKEKFNALLELNSKMTKIDIARNVELIRDKMYMHRLYGWYMNVLEHELVPRSIQIVGDLLMLSDRTALLDAAFARLAYASDRTVKRLQSLSVSKTGKFSMASFGSLPKGMDLSMPQTATVRNNAEEVTRMLSQLKPSAPVVNNNIELTLDVESIRSEDDIERLAGQIANEIAKELPNKMVTE